MRAHSAALWRVRPGVQPEMSPLQSQVSLTHPQHISQSGAQGLLPRRLHTLGLCHCPVSARVWMSAEGSFPTITNLCLPQSLPSAKVTRLQALARACSPLVPHPGQGLLVPPRAETTFIWSTHPLSSPTVDEHNGTASLAHRTGSAGFCQEPVPAWIGLSHSTPHSGSSQAEGAQEPAQESLPHGAPLPIPGSLKIPGCAPGRRRAIEAWSSGAASCSRSDGARSV